jgi:hypothetical protein
VLFLLLVSEFQNIRRETSESIASETLMNVYQTARRHILKIKVPIFVALTISQLLERHQTDIYSFVDYLKPLSVIQIYSI